jgi:hypothetical protein
MKLPTRAFLAALHLLMAASLAACDDPKPNKNAPDAAATTKATTSAAAEPPKPKGMPELLVDTMGPYLGGKRIDMAKGDAAEKLAQAVKELPIEGKPVTLLVDKKAKPPYVAAVVYELGVAGAPKVTVKTDGRDDVPKEIVLTPETRASTSSLPACSVSAAVMKDLSTAVWPFKGGLGKRQRKGFAGPDLSHTGETLKKEIAICNSSTAFFSTDDSLEWETAYNIAGTLINSDEKKKIDTLILPRETPVAGRPITLKQ